MQRFLGCWHWSSSGSIASIPENRTPVSIHVENFLHVEMQQINQNYIEARTWGNQLHEEAYFIFKANLNECSNHLLIMSKIPE